MNIKQLVLNVAKHRVNNIRCCLSSLALFQLCVGLLVKAEADRQVSVGPTQWRLK